ncbi:hypothetical protein F5Y03DRAFT_98345 [Xylaria venustula]|nr:hypothetical protein F5Y03DRAFT_98345 [Xylaria venustula]
MATGNDNNPNNGPQSPFAYVLIPVLGFGLIVSLITCYRFRRRKRRLARLVEEGGPTFSRDPETGRTRIDRRDGDRTVATGRRRAGRRLGLGVGSREEGLNELGEAPPAYTPNAPKPPSIENIELMSYSQATAEIGTSRSPPQYGEASSAVASGQSRGPTVGSTSANDDDDNDGVSEAGRLSQEMRRGPHGNATTNGSGDAERISQELRRNAVEIATTTASSAGDSARRSQETRSNAAGSATTSDTRDSTRLSQELPRDTTRDATTDITEDITANHGSIETARSSQETRRDHSGNGTGTITATTTEETAATNTTTTTPSTSEPAPPPRAVLPPPTN